MTETMKVTDGNDVFTAEILDRETHMGDEFAKVRIRDTEETEWVEL